MNYFLSRIFARKGRKKERYTYRQIYKNYVIKEEKLKFASLNPETEVQRVKKKKEKRKKAGKREVERQRELGHGSFLTAVAAVFFVSASFPTRHFIPLARSSKT